MKKYYIKKQKGNEKKYIKSFGFILISVGVIFFLYFLFPVISYQIFLARAFSDNEIEAPVPKRLVAETGNIGSLFSQGISAITTDYSDARNWYPSVVLPQQITQKTTEEKQEQKQIDSYFLTIPKLKIENAVVSTVDYNLDQHVVQYLGTSLPGNKGTTVLFGHSTIPAWFDPSNYKTIFATLHTIKRGDEIDTIVNGVVYKYKIFSINITSPEDTNMFSQSYDTSYLTLVTCTPPGTTWKRLIVRASLVD